jgi:hypothetical protein
MTEQTPQDKAREGEKKRPEPRDAAYWAQYAETLMVAGAAEGATNINVEGRRAVGLLQSFGQLWQKTYRVRLAGIETTPEEDESHPANSRQSDSDFRRPRLLQWQRC